VNKSLIIQVILMTAIMMLGLMITAKKENNYRRKKGKQSNTRCK
jgi:hypothetical protein